MMDFSSVPIDDLIKSTIDIGSVYRVKMDEKNGITPKQGDESRNKFFVVLGVEDVGNVYGGVIINSAINQGLPQSIKDYHMPILCSKYPFLTKDSFVNCANLKTYPLHDFLKSTKLGDIQEDDLEIIKGTVISSPNEKKVNLKRFGLL